MIHQCCDVRRHCMSKHVCCQPFNVDLPSPVVGIFQGSQGRIGAWEQVYKPIGAFTSKSLMQFAALSSGVLHEDQRANGKLAGRLGMVVSFLEVSFLLLLSCKDMLFKLGLHLL